MASTSKSIEITPPNKGVRPFKKFKSLSTTHTHTHRVPTCIQPLEKPPGVRHTLLNSSPSSPPCCHYVGGSGWSPSLQDLSSRRAPHITARLAHIPPTSLGQLSTGGPPPERSAAIERALRLLVVAAVEWRGGRGGEGGPPK